MQRGDFTMLEKRVTTRDKGFSELKMEIEIVASGTTNHNDSMSNQEYFPSISLYSDPLPKPTRVVEALNQTRQIKYQITVLTVSIKQALNVRRFAHAAIPNSLTNLPSAS